MIDVLFQKQDMPKLDKKGRGRSDRSTQGRHYHPDILQYICAASPLPNHPGTGIKMMGGFLRRQFPGHSIVNSAIST